MHDCSSLTAPRPLVQGIGFDYEAQYQEALDKQYPVSSGAEQQAAAAAKEAKADLAGRFVKAAEDPSEQPGYSDLSATERIKARVKYAVSVKSYQSRKSGTRLRPMPVATHQSALRA